MFYRLNKKGWVMVLESAIAVIILFSFLFTAISRQSIELNEQNEFYNIANKLAEKTYENDEIRNYVLNGDEDEINNFLNEEIGRMKVKANAEGCISDADENCFIEAEAEEIAVSEVVIASDFNSYAVKKLRIFVYKS